METTTHIQLEPDYVNFINNLKQRVKSARLTACLAINKELVLLYWQIGRSIIEKQQTSQWGSKLLSCMSKDLKNSFPDMRGFSITNLIRMRQFASLYPNIEFGAQAVLQLPWGHIIVLMQKIKCDNARKWYIQQAQVSGWSRSELIKNINQKLYQRQSHIAIKQTNFQNTLSKPLSDLANQLIKEPYDFGFLPNTTNAKEKEIEENLILHVRDVLVELGTGFAFVGNQFHLEVGGDDFFIDLLFFNISLNCYVVVELKKGKYKPEHSGKLNFYITAVDEQVCEDHHNPTIGLLLCERKNKIVAEYSLRKMNSPMGISEYQLSRELPGNLKNALPSTEYIEYKLTTG